MQTLILIITGIIAVALGFWLGKKHSPLQANDDKGEKGGKSEEKKIGLIEQQAEEKKRNLEAILGLMRHIDEAQGKESITLTNSQVEAMLGIPESTVTRYFDELEKAGKVRQIGETGRDVAYELK